MLNKRKAMFRLGILWIEWEDLVMISLIELKLNKIENVFCLTNANIETSSLQTRTSWGSETLRKKGSLWGNWDYLVMIFLFELRLK